MLEANGPARTLVMTAANGSFSPLVSNDMNGPKRTFTTSAANRSQEPTRRQSVICGRRTAPLHLSPLLRDA
jgi:hypothetical protein